jgi:hypothetical protein
MPTLETTFVLYYRLSRQRRLCRACKGDDDWVAIGGTVGAWVNGQWVSGKPTQYFKCVCGGETVKALDYTARPADETTFEREVQQRLAQIRNGRWTR